MNNGSKMLGDTCNNKNGTIYFQVVVANLKFSISKHNLQAPFKQNIIQHYAMTVNE